MAAIFEVMFGKCEQHHALDILSENQKICWIPVKTDLNQFEMVPKCAVKSENVPTFALILFYWILFLFCLVPFFRTFAHTYPSQKILNAEDINIP